MTVGVFKEVAIEQRGEVLWLTLNRPEAANAMNSEMEAQMVAALAMAEVDSAVKAVVITGAGNRVFSAGADVKPAPGGSPDAAARKSTNWLMRMLTAIMDFDKPVVIAVNGTASGAAMFLALVGDLAVASSEASFVLSEIDLGRTTFPGLTLVSELAGPKLAADLVLTGRRMSAAEAERNGLVARVAPPAELAERAQELAAFLGAKPPTAMAMNKRWLRGPLREALLKASEASQASRAELMATGEPQAATAAFFARLAARKQAGGQAG